MVAEAMALTSPAPIRIPNCGSSQAPMKAPMMPMTISPTTKARTSHKLPGKPAGDQPYQQNYDQTFIGNCHDFSPLGVAYSRCADTAADQAAGGRKRGLRCTRENSPWSSWFRRHEPLRAPPQ